MTLPIVTPILPPPHPHGTVSIGRANIATARDGLTSLSNAKTQENELKRFVLSVATSEDETAPSQVN
jgi:hypothetical protein